MLDQLAAAFDRQDYRTAAQLLKTLLKQSPQNPWVQFYLGRLHEATEKWEAAEKVYRSLLRETINPKLALQARQGLQRLETMEQERLQQAIAEATADPQNTEPGFLILEPVQGEARPQAVQNFARVMKMDPQVVRLRLPSRHWKLYRTGSIGELQVYGEELRKAGVPVFWASQAAVEQINVFRVSYFQTVAPEVTVVCQNDLGQLGSLTFDWTEVVQWVRGQLPIFEKVVDLGPWGKLQRKEKTQDYAQVCDLHLTGRNCILRLCDSTYQFQDSAIAAEPTNTSQSLLQTTTRINWNSLLNFLNQQLSQTTVRSEFTAFAETTLDHRVPLSRLKAQVDLPRKHETHWDPAFHLYSSLVFLKSLPEA